MLHLFELVQWSRPRTLGRGIGGDPVGVLGLQGLELIEQPVVFQVADNRRIQDVIAVIVQMYLLFELFVAGFRFHLLIIPHSTTAR